MVVGLPAAERLIVGKATYHFEARNADGELLWEDEIHNLVTAAGLNDALEQYFKGSSYTAAWYVGLKGAGTPDSADTMTSHATWNEVVAYSEATREALVLGTVSAGTVSNTASKAEFTMNSSATIEGAFLVNESTKSGTSGILYSVGDFAASRTLGSGDIIQVTVTLTAA